MDYGRSLSGTRETWFLSWPGITEFCHIDGFSLEKLFDFFVHSFFPRMDDFDENS